MYNGYEGPYGYYRPSYTQSIMNQPQQRADYLIKVTGLDGARAYQVPANARVALFDSNEPVFYVKETDSGGYPTLRRYRFVEDEGQHVQPDATFATKDELESIRQQIDELREAVDGKPSDAVLSVIDEHLEALRVVQPRAYEAVMDRLRGI